MASSGHGSAIDDSFEPNFFPFSPPRRDADDHSVYNGPRSGHWSVSSSIGSAIDDRCPTIYGADQLPRSGGQPSAYVRPIEGGLLKKLARATVEKNRAEEWLEQKTGVRDHESVRSERQVEKKKETQPKGFYVPKANVKASPVAKAEMENRYEREQPKKARTPSSAPSVRSEYAPSIASLQPPKVIRIKGKDGREAFMQLPNLPNISRPASRAPSPPPAKAPPKQEPKPNNENKKTKKQRREDQRANDAKAAAGALMSGALPAKRGNKQERAPSQQPKKPTTPVPAVSSQSSTKDSGVGFGGMFQAEERVASVASSRGVSIRSLQDAIRSINQNSQQPKTPSVRSFEQVGEGWMAGNERAKTPSNRSFQQVGEGWTHEAGSQRSSSRASASQRLVSRSGSQHESSAHEHGFAGGAWDEEEHAPAPRQPSRQPEKPRTPTIFAGKGWVSPHPLSDRSALGSSPQSHISIPAPDTDHRRELSYEEWEAIKKGEVDIVEHRSVSRAGSGISKRALSVAASIARVGSQHGSGRVSVAGSQQYRKATVESEHGSQRSGSHKSSQHIIGWENVEEPPRSSTPVNAWAGDALPAGNAWDDGALGFDGINERSARSSTYDAREAYRRRLQDIADGRASRQQVPLTRGLQQPEQVQLAMPWDSASSYEGQERGYIPPQYREAGPKTKQAWAVEFNSMAKGLKKSDDERSIRMQRIEEMEKGYGGF